MMERDRSALVMFFVNILMLLLIGVSAIMSLRLPFWCFIVAWLVVSAILVNKK